MTQSDLKALEQIRKKCEAITESEVALVKQVFQLKLERDGITQTEYCTQRDLNASALSQTLSARRNSPETLKKVIDYINGAA